MHCLAYQASSNQEHTALVEEIQLLEMQKRHKASQRRLLESMNTHSETHDDYYQESLHQGGI